MTEAEARQGWRIVIISQVLPIVEPLVPYLRELGHEPVAWLMARRSRDDNRPLPPWGGHRRLEGARWAQLSSRSRQVRCRAAAPRARA